MFIPDKTKLSLYEVFAINSPDMDKVNCKTTFNLDASDVTSDWKRIVFYKKNDWDAAKQLPEMS